MSQNTGGLLAVLSHPVVYSLFQKVMGAHRVRTYFTHNFIKPETGDFILDIGCGPADILDYLPSVKYWGFDISDAYISRAMIRFAGRGQFSCKILKQDDLDDLPPIDIALAIGLLHHLDDEEAVNLLTLIRSALKPGGRLITVDPCFEPGQYAGWIAPPKVGIDNKPGDYEYVKLHMA